MILNNISKELIKWYQVNQRLLPWRTSKDPYTIWLSEIILQQTRINQGQKYWEKFLNKFPSVQNLASAKESEVLALWSGLGYYSRARNIHKTSKIIVKKYSNEFPSSSRELAELPGIGPYTAAAISSICFNEVIPALDGNAYRVYSRLFGIDLPIEKNIAINKIKDLALPLISKKQPGDSNQAIMDIGSGICKPKNPKCFICPLQEYCFARKNGNPESYPVKSKIKKSLIIDNFYIIVRKHDKYAFIQRPDKGIWAGLFTPIEMDEKSWKLALKNKSIDSKSVTTLRHILSHRIMNLHFSKWNASNIPEESKVKWHSQNDLKSLGLPAPIKKILVEKSYI
jgi:A/G-specific adenine glycosylase